MSRQFPIYLTDSEEEPMYATDSEEEPSEDSYEADAAMIHELEHPPVVPGATSDDSAIDTPPSPPTDPATRMLGSTFMETRHMTAETSRGPLPRRTPRMSVRDLPTGPLAPRDKAPMTEPETLPEEPPQKRLRVARLDWMPHVLREWRSLEGLPSTFEAGESSHTPSPVPLTGEPLELTVPTLVAVIYTLFRMSSDRCMDIRELRSDTSRLDGDVASIYGRLAAVETHRDADRESADTTRARVDLLGRRATIVGVAAGVSVVVTVVRTIVGMYLYYFR